MPGEHSGQDHTHQSTLKLIPQTWLPNTWCRTFKITFAVCRDLQSCSQNVASTCSPTRMTSFCSCCRYKDQFNKLLLAYCTAYDAFCKMERYFVWILRGPELCVLFVHKPIKVEMNFITKPQAVIGSRVLLHKL